MYPAFGKYFDPDLANYYTTDIEKAKSLLLGSNLSVEAVATAVGYSNLYYFSNSFKAHTGKSPSQYRKD